MTPTGPFTSDVPFLFCRLAITLLTRCSRADSCAQHIHIGQELEPEPTPAEIWSGPEPILHPSSKARRSTGLRASGFGAHYGGGGVEEEEPFDSAHESRTMSGMAVRTERIEARIDPDSAERIRYASALEHTSMSGFLVAAAAEKAERVIAEHAYTLVPGDYFDRLLEVLDQPAEPMPELAAVARREREHPRFRRT